MGHYKTIDGIRYEQELLDVAQKATEGRGESRISYDEAKSLIDSAMDGGRITRTERRTLHYIFDTFTLTDKAKDYMVAELFRIDNDQHYDSVLLDAADLAIEGRGDGRISQDDAELIWKMIESDGKVTAVERRTLTYILEKYKCTEPAAAFLNGKLG